AGTLRAPTPADEGAPLSESLLQQPNSSSAHAETRDLGKTGPVNNTGFTTVPAAQSNCSAVPTATEEFFLAQNSTKQKMSQQPFTFPFRLTPYAVVVDELEHQNSCRSTTTSRCPADIKDIKVEQPPRAPPQFHVIDFFSKKHGKAWVRQRDEPPVSFQNPARMPQLPASEVVRTAALTEVLARQERSVVLVKKAGLPPVVLDKAAAVFTRAKNQEDRGSTSRRMLLKSSKPGGLRSLAAGIDERLAIAKFALDNPATHSTHWRAIW
ncbi:unnamed protein product, partial [Amoebophrya sp. A120]